MISSFDADFQAFINNRLDSVGKAVLNNMADSYSAIINIYENACYRQGFRDGLRFVTEI